VSGRRLLDEQVPRLELVLGDRGFRDLAHRAASTHGAMFEVRGWVEKPAGGFLPIRPRWRVEDCSAHLGAWWRLPLRSRLSPACLPAETSTPSGGQLSRVFVIQSPGKDAKRSYSASFRHIVVTSPWQPLVRSGFGIFCVNFRTISSRPATTPSLVPNVCGGVTGGGEDVQRERGQVSAHLFRETERRTSAAYVRRSLRTSSRRAPRRIDHPRRDPVRRSIGKR
jgi:hypothetical protein